MEKVCPFSALEVDRPAKASRDIILVKHGGKLRALGARCPHAGADLEAGAVFDGKLICPWHKAAFRLDTGKVLEPPALDDLPTYETHVEDGMVFVADRPKLAADASRRSALGPSPAVGARERRSWDGRLRISSKPRLRRAYRPGG